MDTRNRTWASVLAAEDEIGELETLFERFRTLFVEALGEAERGSGRRSAGGGGRP